MSKIAYEGGKERGHRNATSNFQIRKRRKKNEMGNSEPGLEET